VRGSLILSPPAGVLGHREALREVLANPDIPYEEASGPWTLQAALGQRLSRRATTHPALQHGPLGIGQ
jgi:hypothetical protein